MAQPPADDTAISDAITEQFPALAARRRVTEAIDEDDGESAEDAEIWLVSYIDLLTLLITFFVLMLSFADFSSLASVKQKVEEMVQERIARQQPFAGPTGPSAQKQQENQQLAAALRTTLGGAAAEVSVVDNAVVVEIADSVLFRPGEYELSPQGAQLVDRLALNVAVGRIFARDETSITVEGHTDATRIATDRIPSNWELSSNRANAVVRRMASQGLDEKRLRSVGYADTRPRAANDTAENRAKNRRVALVFHTADSARAAGRF